LETEFTTTKNYYFYAGDLVVKWTHSCLTPARQAGTWFTYPGEMEVWVDLGYWFSYWDGTLPTHRHPSKH